MTTVAAKKIMIDAPTASAADAACHCHRRRHPALAALAALALAVALAAGVPSAAQAADDVVGDGVMEALRSQGTAQVLIVFDLPAAAQGQGPQNLATPSMRRVIEAEGEAILNELSPRDFKLRHRFGSVNALAGAITANGLRTLMANPNVVRVDLDVGVTGHLNQAIILSVVDVVQNLGLTGSGVTVAVLDTGIDTDHPDLSDDLVAETCFCNNNCCPAGGSVETGPGSAEDDDGHGTNVAGIITSAGSGAPLGGAPDAEIVAVKVLDNNGDGVASDVLAGLDWVMTQDVDIVNMSLGTDALYAGECDFDDANTMAHATAINSLRANGVSVFAASGNDGSGTEMPAPACIANAISVGAVWDDFISDPQQFSDCENAATVPDQVTCFSNSNVTTDLFAPGAPTTSTGLGGGTSTLSGTSQASPLAAACAALLLEVRPTLTVDAIEVALEASLATVIDATNSLLFPRLDCEAAYNVVAADQPPVAVCQDVTVSTDMGVCQAVIRSSVDGGSSDPDGDLISLSQSPPVGSTFPLGDTDVTLTVTDDAGLSDSCIATVTVFDEEPPALMCPDDLQVECAAGGIPATDPAVAAFLGGVTSSDNCPTVVSLTNSAPDSFDVGTTTVTFTATDANDNTSACTANVTVNDNTAPILSVSLDPDLLWPPNHRLREVSATVVAEDQCASSPVVRLLSIESSEPDNGLEDGDTPDDIQGADLDTEDVNFQLRAERAGDGPGRIYTVTYAATDAAGNAEQVEATVTVPMSFGE